MAIRELSPNRWILESDDPSTMQKYRQIFTGLKIIIVILLLNLVVWSLWIQNPYLILRELVYGVPMISILIILNVLWKYFHAPAGPLESPLLPSTEELQSFINTLQWQWAIPPPVSPKLRIADRSGRKSDILLGMDPRLSSWKVEITSQLMRLKTHTHLGVLIYQILFFSLYCLFTPLAFQRLLPILLPELTTFSPIGGQGVIALSEYLAWSLYILHSIGLTSFLLSAVLPIFLLGSIVPTSFLSIQQRRKQLDTAKNLPYLIFGLGAALVFGWINGFTLLLAGIAALFLGILSGFTLWLLIAMLINWIVYRDYFHFNEK